MGKFNLESFYKRLASIATERITRIEPKLLSVRLTGPYCCKFLKRQLNGSIVPLHENPNYGNSFMKSEKNDCLKSIL